MTFQNGLFKYEYLTVTKMKYRLFSASEKNIGINLYTMPSRCYIIAGNSF